MSGPRILIVTYNWPPRNTIATHRAYAWAKYWSAGGAQVTVLTAEKIPSDSPLDLHLPEIDGVRVIEVPFAALRGRSIVAWAAKNKIVRNALSKIRSIIRDSSTFDLDPRARWTQVSIEAIKSEARNFDYVVSTYGPDSAHLIAAEIKTINPSLFWLADYRDLWSQNPMVPWSEKVRASVRAREVGSVGERADAVSVVSSEMKNQLNSIIDIDTIVSPNGFDIDIDTVKLNFEQRSQRDPSVNTNIVHTGSIYVGHRDPTPVVDAILNLEKRGDIKTGTVTVELYGANLEKVGNLRKSVEYRKILNFRGYVTRDASLEIQKRASLLLLMVGSDPDSKGVITGKVFEYIASGCPIICLCPDGFEVRNVLRDTGTGVSVDASDIGSIERVIRNFVDSRGKPQWFEPSISEIAKYRRSQQSMELLSSIQTLSQARSAKQIVGKSK